MFCFNKQSTTNYLTPTVESQGATLLISKPAIGHNSKPVSGHSVLMTNPHATWTFLVASYALSFLFNYTQGLKFITSPGPTW